MKFTLKDLAHTALCAAILCVVAPFSLTAGANLVPISLATFCVMLFGLAFGWAKAVVAVLVYLALGAAGLPVFAKGMGGIAVLAGPTGGYLVGYLFLAFFSGIFFRRKFYLQILMVLAGTVVLYAFGTAWFMIQQKAALAPSLLSCVVPFLPGDAVKIAAAFGMARLLKKRKIT